MLKEFFQVFKYLYYFCKNRLFVMIILSTVVALLDSFGIILLFPLLTILLDNQEVVLTNNQFLNKLFSLFNSVGLSKFEIIIILISIFIIKSFVLFASSRYSVETRAILLKNMKESLYKNVFKMPYVKFVEGNTGERINIITEQVNKSLGLFTNFNKVLALTFLASFPVVSAIYISPKIGSLALVVCIILGGAFRLLNMRIRKYSKQLLQANTRVSKIIIQNYQNYKYLRSTGADNIAKVDFQNGLYESVLIHKKIGNTQAVASSFREILLIGSLALLVFVHVKILEGLLSEIVVVMFLLYRGVNALVNVQIAIQKVVENIAPIKAVYSQAYKVQKITDGYQTPHDVSYENFNSLVLENVHFRYPSTSHDVLLNMNIEFNAYQSYAVIGKSGSGKTTLIDLMLGLLEPTKGSVVISKGPTKTVGNGDNNLNIGYITQDPILLDGSLRENVELFNWKRKLKNTDEEILFILGKCGLTEFLNSIDNDLSFQIGERGSKLSGGIKQRLLIARELLRNPDILVLDEATSALDEASENAVYQILQEIKGTCTIIIITHRPKLLKLVDKVYTVQNGSVVENIQ